MNALLEMGIRDPAALVRRFVAAGAVKVFPPRGLRVRTQAELRQLERQRQCMARLRAERRGQATDGLPRRVRARGAGRKKRIA